MVESKDDFGFSPIKKRYNLNDFSLFFIENNINSPSKSVTFESPKRMNCDVKIYR